MRRVILGSLVGIASMAVQFGSARTASAQIASEVVEAQEKEIKAKAAAACARINADSGRTADQQATDCATVNQIAAQACALLKDVAAFPNSVTSNGQLVVNNAQQMMQVVVNNPGCGIPGTGDSISIVTDGGSPSGTQPITLYDVAKTTWTTTGVTIRVTVTCPTPPGCTVEITLFRAGGTTASLPAVQTLFDPGVTGTGSKTITIPTQNDRKAAGSNLFGVLVKIRSKATGLVTSVGCSWVHLSTKG